MIRALLYTVFDKEKGPAIGASDPPAALEGQFQHLGRYFLPDKSLCGKVINVHFGEARMVGMPIYIEDRARERNVFQFCVCFVLAGGTALTVWRSLASQLATCFLEVENDIKFLSASPRHAIENVLYQIRKQLNEAEICYVPVGDFHCINFRLSAGPRPPAATNASNVEEKIDKQNLTNF